MKQNLRLRFNEILLNCTLNLIYHLFIDRLKEPNKLKGNIIVLFFFYFFCVANINLNIFLFDEIYGYTAIDKIDCIGMSA